MNLKCEIYLICYINNRPVDFLLPVYSKNEYEMLPENAGSSFKIKNPLNAEIMLASKENYTLYLFKINIEKACKANSNISFSIVTDKDDVFLRVFTDVKHNAYYKITDVYQK